MNPQPLSAANDANPFNPDCRDPARYHVTHAGATELEVGAFLAGLVRALQPRIVIETGTSWGDTTMQLAQALKVNGHGRLLTIDVRANQVGAANEALRGYPARAIVGDATQVDWAEHVQGRAVDFAFIDGGQDRGAEFERIHPFLSPVALVAFHDVSNGLAPARVVERLVADGHILPPLYLPTPRGLAIARVRP